MTRPALSEEDAVPGYLWHGKPDLADQNRLIMKQRPPEPDPPLPYKSPKRVSGPGREPQHGTLSEYSNYRCRCQPCKDANARWQRDRRELLRLGYIRGPEDGGEEAMTA